jgi:hypothetical protein
MVAIAARGLPVAYYSFRGRRHGSQGRDPAARSNWNSIFMAACSVQPPGVSERVDIVNMPACED